MSRVIDFYSKLPRGMPKKDAPKGFLGRYKARHFDGEHVSAKPLLHAVIGLFLLGYTLQYTTHLRHHKNHEH